MVSGEFSESSQAGQMSWCTPGILALTRQRQKSDGCGAGVDSTLSSCLRQCRNLDGDEGVR